MSKFEISDPYLRRMVYAIGVMGLISFGFYTFSLVREFFAIIINVLTPFMAALLMAYILAPVVITLQKQLRLGRIMGTLVLYLIIVLLVFLLLTFLIPTILSEFIRLFNTVKAALPDLLKKLSQNPHVKIDQGLIQLILDNIAEIELDYERLAKSILPGLKSVTVGGLEAMRKATRGIFIGVGSVVGFISFLIFVGIINFYFIIDWEKIAPILRKVIPLKYRNRAFDILGKIDIAVGGFLRGQLTVSAIVGVLFATGLFCMGFIGFPALRNYCILIGTAAAIGGFIPYLGPVIGVTPAILIILLTSGVVWKTKLMALIAVLVLFAIIQGIEGFVLQPKIVGKGAGLHPLAVMLALIFGAQIGIGGMILAIPIACVIKVLFIEFYWRSIENREAEIG